MTKDELSDLLDDPFDDYFELRLAKLGGIPGVLQGLQSSPEFGVCTGSLGTRRSLFGAFSSHRKTLSHAVTMLCE
jgi:hypothetical protein